MIPPDLEGPRMMRTTINRAITAMIPSLIETINDMTVIRAAITMPKDLLNFISVKVR